MASEPFIRRYDPTNSNDYDAIVEIVNLQKLPPQLSNYH